MKSMRNLLLTIGGLAAAGAAAFFLLRNGETKPVAANQPTAAESNLIQVKTIKPRRDSTFRIATEQLASVEPFYQAGLRSRVAGVVKNVWKDIGEPVRAGELLVEIDVPDLQKELEQTEAVIAQRLKEWKLAAAHVKNAEAALKVAQANVRQREAEQTAAESYRDLAAKRLKRFRDLLARDSVSPDVVDEQEREHLARSSAADAARIAVQKAQVDISEKEASLEASRVDVELKEALVAVARKGTERLQALVDYARITAPFDGVITRRNVDPGMFVANSATSATAEPLVNVARTDMVTISMKVPDNVAELISLETEAELELDDMPGVAIRGRVTRYAPVIDGGDRTVRIEVDLFNGTRADYERKTGRSIAAIVMPIGSASPLIALTNTGVDVCQLRLSHKGCLDCFPACPDWGVGKGKKLLFPGMTGYMKLFLEQVSESQLLPSSAVFTVGGKPYLLLVEDGRAKRVPVKVLVNDGQLVKVSLVTRAGEGRTRRMEQTRELDGTEEVIASRQQELSDGQRVKPVPSPW